MAQALHRMSTGSTRTLINRKEVSSTRQAQSRGEHYFSMCSQPPVAPSMCCQAPCTFVKHNVYLHQARWLPPPLSELVCLRFLVCRLATNLPAGLATQPVPVANTAILFVPPTVVPPNLKVVDLGTPQPGG